MILIFILLMIIYYGSFAKIMCYMFSVAFVVYVGFNLVLYKFYEYLKHIKAIEKRTLFDALFSVGNIIRRCFLFSCMSISNPLEKGVTSFGVNFIYQLYKGKLNKKVLFFTSCIIMFNCFMQDYYSTFLSFISVDILVCYYDNISPVNSRERVGIASSTLDTIPPLNLRKIVGIGSPADADIATVRVKHLSYDRKIEIMEQVRRKLIHNSSPDVNKLALFNYGQLGVLKNLCSEPTLRNRTP